ncbi:hypothetical protein QTJ16_005712 [Diplocarpon rosae]|uniref:Uncharacterized protein n=1 Tax=Diplocarpon rosae TaxID=946125 RepID=A0AAD9SVH0_9HELO|nr:hypothetical protein QTJ16_005712 [Diplocarpon rosae]
MADPSNGAVPPGDNSKNGLFEEPEQNFTPEQLAMIQDAMMEELGIGRKDKLYLDDIVGGEDISKLVLKPKKRNMHSATAAWRIAVFDDVDPADKELDSIADGQLYRLRRGDASSSLSRGRGNGAPRGGRGGGHGRGGRYVNGSVHNPSTPQTFFAARAAVNSQPQAEYAASRLSDPAPFSMARRQSNGPSHRGGHQDKANAAPSKPQKPSKPLNALPVKPRFALANSNEAFLAHAGYVQRAALPAQAAAPQQKPIGPLQSKKSVDMSSAPTAPLADRMRQLKLSENALRRNTRVSDLTSPMKRPQKLSPGVLLSPGPSVSAAAIPEPLSRATSPVQVRSPPVAPEPANQKSNGLSSSRWAPTVTPAQIPGRVVIRSYAVKFKKDQGPAKAGTAELVKNSADQYFKLELVEAGTDHMMISELITDDDFFEQDRNLVIFRAALPSAQKPPTWRLIFPLPHMADRFAQSVLLSRRGRPVAQPSVLNDVPAAQGNSDAGPALHLASGASVDTVPQGAPAPENGDTEHLISLEPEAEPAPKPVNPYFIEFLEFFEVENEDIVNDLFSRLKEGITCTVLDQLSCIVVQYGGTPAHELSSEEILSSPDYLIAIQGPVGCILRSSETFCKLPDEFSNEYLLEKSQKVLAMAVAERHVDQGAEARRAGEDIAPVDHTTTTISATDGSQSNAILDYKTQPHTSRASPDIHLLEPFFQHGVTGLVAPERTAVHQPETPLESTLPQVDSTEHSGVLESTIESRVKYSPDSLLSLRPNAVPVEIHVQFPLKPDQSRRPARGMEISKPVSTTGGWKSFADMNLHEAYLFTAGPAKPATSQSTETSTKSEAPFRSDLSKSAVRNRDTGDIAATKQSSPSSVETLLDVGETGSLKKEAEGPLVKAESTTSHQNLQASTHVAPAQTETISEPAPCPVAAGQKFINEVSNLNLRGVSGLSSSQWASSASAPDFTPRNLQEQTSPSVDPLTVPRGAGQWRITSQPTSPVFPSPPATNGAPIYQTVYIIDVATGGLVPITGVLNPQRVQPMINPYGVPDTSSFPARESSGSDKGFAPDHNARTASDAPSPTGGQRPALSPRKGNTLQARLQSRLNNSMAGSRGSFQGPRF